MLLTGSPSNVEPHHYGKESREGTLHDAARDATTLPLIRHTIARGVPLLAICRGLQEVNVALGGSLHQHVHEVDGRRDHRSPKSPDMDVNYAPAHDIDIVEGGMLHRLLGERRVKVNSLHGQGVDMLSPRAKIEAICCEDGQVEALSIPDALGFRPRAAVAPRIQGAGESDLHETVRRFCRGLSYAHDGACRIVAARGGIEPDVCTGHP